MRISPRSAPRPLGIASSERARKLGIRPADRADIGARPHSTILDVLPPPRWCEIKAVKVPGKVIWFNFALARDLGIELPPGDRMTPELHARLVDALSLRLLGPTETAKDRPTAAVFADRYGGPGKPGTEGSGRAAFLPWGNLNIKGIGKTPLVTARAPFDHGHGGAPMREGFLEAIWGEVNANLFTHASTQILAVIDTGDHTLWPDGSRERRALIIRAGQQLRPAHIFDGRGGFSMEYVPHDTAAQVFVDATRVTGDLVTHDAGGAPKPDLRATMRRLIDKHAQSAAERFRWRVMHGAVAAANMSLDGALLDLGTETSLPRTPAARVLQHTEAFGKEHLAQAAQLQQMYDAVCSRIVPSQAKACNAGPIDCVAETRTRYAQYLELQLLQAMGLKPSAAERLGIAQPELVRRWAEIIQQLARLQNTKAASADKSVPEDVSVVDVFGALQRLARLCARDPTTITRATVLEALQPRYLADPQGNATHSTCVAGLAEEMAETYHRIMSQAALQASDVCAFWRSAVARAEFENRPLDLLYRARLNDTLTGAIAAYQLSGDPEPLRTGVDRHIAGSLRSVEGLLRQGTRTATADGGWLVQQRTIDGIDYAVRTGTGGARSLVVSLPIAGDEAQGYSLATVPDAPRLSAADLAQLTYRYTTDGWKTYRETRATVENGRATYEIPIEACEVGELEGIFRLASGQWVKDGSSNFRGYIFAVPDDDDMRALS